MPEIGYIESDDADASQQQVSITPIKHINNNDNKEESPNTNNADQTFDTLNTSAETDTNGSLITPIKSPVKDDIVQSVSPSTNNTNDTNTTNIEESQNEKFRAPEAPRWRFAKKTGMVKGYSSRDAGIIIKGKSSQELGAQYETPNITTEELIKPSERRKSDIELSKLKQLNYSKFEITRRNSDKMGPTDIKYSVFEKEEEDVGRLSNSEKESNVLEVLEGGIVISHDKVDKEEIDIGSRVWSNHHPRSTAGMVLSDYDKDEYTNLIDNDSSEDTKLKSVGKLNVGSVGGSMDEFEGGIPRRSQVDGLNTEQAISPPGTPTQINTSAEQTNSPMRKRKLWGMPFIPTLHHANEDGKTVQTNGSGGSPVPPIDDNNDTGSDSRDIHEGINDPNLNDKGDLSENNIVGDSRRKRRRLILLLLLLLLVISAIIGAVLGTKRPSEGSRMSAVILADENTTDQGVSSSMPSSVPSYFGPGDSYNTGSSVVQRPPWKNEEEENNIGTEQIPWVDSEVVDSLIPIEGLTSSPTASPDSSIGSSTPQPPSKAPSIRPVSDSPTQQPSSKPITESPTKQPTQQPVTQSPTPQPSKSPVKSSVVSSSQVTVNFFDPTQSPSNNPSKGPTNKVRSIVCHISVVRYSRNSQYHQPFFV